MSLSFGLDFVRDMCKFRKRKTIFVTVHVLWKCHKANFTSCHDCSKEIVHQKCMQRNVKLFFRCSCYCYCHFPLIHHNPFQTLISFTVMPIKIIKKYKIQTCLVMGCYVVEVKLFFVGFPQLHLLVCKMTERLLLLVLPCLRTNQLAA